MDDTSFDERDFWLDQKTHKILDAEGGIKVFPVRCNGETFPNYRSISIGRIRDLES
jgi:hypothetical protein